MKKIFLFTLFVLILSNNSFPQWTNANGLTNHWVFCISGQSENLFAGTNSFVYRSTDGGANWIRTGYEIDSLGIQSLFVNGSDIYAGAVAFSGGHGSVYYSPDNGSNWKRISDVITNSPVASILVKDSVIFAAFNSLVDGRGQIFRKPVKDSVWTKVFDLTETPVEDFLLSGDSIYAVCGANLGAREYLLVSVDNGLNWNSVNGLPGYGILKMLITETKFFIGTGSGLYCSTDKGSTWNLLSNGIPTYLTYNNIIKEKNIILAASGYETYVSFDDGESWSKLFEKSFQCIAMRDDRIFLGRYDGLQYSSISNLTSAEEQAHLPLAYNLNQNYPNPFNPETNISYSLPKEAIVTLKLYNILGQEVQTLLNEFKEAGTYTYKLNVAGLNSGIYFYELKTDGYKAVKKMILMK